MKHGRKVVCGTQEGVLLVFTWGRWGDCSDRYPGHPETVDCMYKIDESTVMTGSSDGLIRAVSVQPNKMIGVLGDHEEFPVEGMYASTDGKFMASFAHDNLVRFNDISMFCDDDDETEVEEAEGADAQLMTAAEGEEQLDGSDASGDDYDDEEGEEAMDDEESSEFDSCGSDSDSDGPPAAGGGGGYKIKTAAEKFYSDM